MSDYEIGVVGFIEYNHQRYDFSHFISQLNDTQLTSFPASEGPRSIVTGNDEEQREKYTTAYEKTDHYVNNLLNTNAEKNTTFASTSQQLCQLTHCLQKTRQETDNVLTMVMNKAFPTKRPRVPNGNDDLNVDDEQDNAMDIIDPALEDVKRQRALDTTEYFSGSEDEGDEKVQL